MAKKNLIELSDTELFSNLDEAKDNIFTLRMRKLTSGDDPASSASSIRNTKRVVARLLTEIRRREINTAEVIQSLKPKEVNLSRQLAKQVESVKESSDIVEDVEPKTKEPKTKTTKPKKTKAKKEKTKEKQVEDKVELVEDIEEPEVIPIVTEDVEPKTKAVKSKTAKTKEDKPKKTKAKEAKPKKEVKKLKKEKKVKKDE